MQKVNRLQDKWRNVVFFLTGLLIIAVDQFSKAWIRTNLFEGQSLLRAGFFRITHIHNTGAAFGLFSDQSFALTIVTFIVIAVLLVYVMVTYRYFPLLDSGLGSLVLGLVLGGAVGNLIDRLRFGYVTDFIDFSFWPAFNAADSAITIGVMMFVYYIMRLAQTEKH